MEFTDIFMIIHMYIYCISRSNNFLLIDFSHCFDSFSYSSFDALHELLLFS